MITLLPTLGSRKNMNQTERNNHFSVFYWKNIKRCPLERKNIINSQFFTSHLVFFYYYKYILYFYIIRTIKIKHTS